MPTRRSPGPAPQPWRPRKIQQEYEELAVGVHKPTTIAGTIKVLPEWEAFLREKAVDSDAVTIHDYIAWEQRLAAAGFNRTAQWKLQAIRSMYKLKARAYPDSKWSKLWAEMRTRGMPKVIGKRERFKAYPLELLPKILEAARAVVQFAPGKPGAGERPTVVSEAYTVVATFLYGGGRAQWYGLRTDQAEKALDEKYVELFVKEGEWTFVPIHDKLLAIWKDWLAHRDFDGPMFFRHGRDPYAYQGGSTDWRGDSRAAASNDWNVQRIMHPLGAKERARDADSVQRRLRELYGLDELLQAHRFRKSVATYMEQYGFEEAERRLQLSHGAKTITQEYSDPKLEALQVKLSKMDLGSAEWVAAHNPPHDLFANGNGGDSAILEELRRENRELHEELRQMRELLAKFAPKVVA